MPTTSTPNDAASRFESIRAAAAGLPLERAVHALAQIVRRDGETDADVWARWSGASGADCIAERSGAAVVAWMELQLPAAPSKAARGLASAAAKAGLVADLADELRRCEAALARLASVDEQRVRDVQCMGGREAIIQSAWRALDERRTILNEKRAALLDALRAPPKAATPESAAKERADDAYASCWMPADDARLLAERPTASRALGDGWITASFEGRTVYATPTLLDLSGTPHVSGWEKHAHPAYGADGGREINAAGMIPSGDGSPLVPLAMFVPTWDARRAGVPVMVFADGDRLISANLNFVRYFTSKHRGRIDFIAHGAMIEVRRNGRIVGLFVGLSGELSLTRAEVATLVERGKTVRARLPDPMTLRRDAFAARCTYTASGSGWMVRWGETVLTGDAEEFNHPHIGRTITNGRRVFRTKRAAIEAALSAHGRAVRWSIAEGRDVAPDVLAEYNEASGMKAAA